MPMDIYEEMNVSTLKCLTHHFFHTHYFRGRLLHRVQPLAVEVQSCQTTSVVTDNYAVRVEHWYNFEDERVSEDSCLSLITKHRIDDTFHDKRAIGLTWVDSRTQYHALSVCYLILCR